MQPNIVFILIDDLGWRDLSCYGSTFYETPNLDRLAAQGMRFTQAYAASPVCSPTRAAIMSGKHPTRVGVTQFIGGHTVGRLRDVPYFHALPMQEISLATALKRGGYQTWHVGKWHLGDWNSWPERHGFDVNIAGSGWGMPFNGYFSPYGMPNLTDGPVGEYLTDRLTDEAIRLIQNSDSRPFFLNLWHYATHVPIQAPRQLVEKYERKARALGLDQQQALLEGEFFPCQHKRTERVTRRVVQSDPTYAAMVENLDTNIGRLLQSLETKGVADNTIVIFTSDNGGLATAEGSPTCNLPLAEGKGWNYEGGTRVSQIVRWPQVVRAGRLSDTPVTSMDFYPTLLEAVGLPAMPEQHSDGASLMPLLRGRSRLKRRPLIWHYPHYSSQGGTPAISIRDGDWKLIQFYEDNSRKLFNLRNDPGEQHDMADAQPEVVAQLARQLARWSRQVEALIPKPNPNYIPPPMTADVHPATV